MTAFGPAAAQLRWEIQGAGRVLAHTVAQSRHTAVCPGLCRASGGQKRGAKMLTTTSPTTLPPQRQTNKTLLYKIACSGCLFLS